jgi:hypothetical protein
MSSHGVSSKGNSSNVTIRVSGKLFHGHLSYLDQLVQSAADCQLWPLLNLSGLEELDRAALYYLMRGENRAFSIGSCPNFVREWMEHERERAAA